MMDLHFSCGWKIVPLRQFLNRRPASDYVGGGRATDQTRVLGQEDEDSIAEEEHVVLVHAAVEDSIGGFHQDIDERKVRNKKRKQRKRDYKFERFVDEKKIGFGENWLSLNVNHDDMRAETETEKKKLCFSWREFPRILLRETKKGGGDQDNIF